MIAALALPADYSLCAAGASFISIQRRGPRYLSIGKTGPYSGHLTESALYNNVSVNQDIIRAFFKDCVPSC